MILLKKQFFFKYTYKKMNKEMLKFIDVWK